LLPAKRTVELGDWHVACDQQKARTRMRPESREMNAIRAMKQYIIIK
jgi:hypothetical protein